MFFASRYEKTRHPPAVRALDAEALTNICKSTYNIPIDSCRGYVHRETGLLTLCKGILSFFEQIGGCYSKFSLKRFSLIRFRHQLRKMLTKKRRLLSVADCIARDRED